MDATSLLLILMSGCYITDSLKLSESTSTPKYACGETIVLTCSRAAGETAIPDELTWKQNGISWSTCFKTTNNDCTVVSVGNRKFSSDVTKGEYNLTLTTATLEDTGTWLCEALSYSTASLTLTIRALPKGVLHVYERNGKLTLETCFAPSSLMVEWFFEDSEANEALTPQTEGSFNESGSCSASVADCIASTTQKYIKQFSFAYDSECGLKVKARLTSTETFIGSIPVFTQTLHGICIRGPITSTAVPTTTITTSTPTATTTTSATTAVQTTASTPSTPTTATLTVTATSMSAPTTATSIVTAPTMSAPSSATTTVTAPTTATSTVTAPTTATSTIIAPTTSAPATVTALTTSPIISSTSSSTTYQSRQNNKDDVGFIIAGCIGGAIVVALLIVIPLCLLRGPMCKGWRSKKPYETSKDPRAKHSSARHHRHGGNSHTRKQYDRPQKSHTPDRSFPNHYKNSAYMGPAGRSSGYHVHTSNPPSYSFYDPFSGEYIRKAAQQGGHSVGQRYAPYPQSQHRGRMQQTWYQSYSPGRPDDYDNSGNWDFYY